jgi:hypothetical protein
MILLFGAWTYLAHSGEKSMAQSYGELANLPIYTFVADTTMVFPILEKLAGIPDVASFEHETGFQAAEELITAYDLPLDESTIANYSFPDLITITFPPSEKGIAAKTKVMELLREYLAEENIDSQSSVYDKLLQALKQKKTNFMGFLLFAALIMFKLLMDIRMSFELKRYHHQVRKSYNVVDMMRLKKGRTKRNWLLMILPPALVIAIYYILGYFKLWEGCNLWRTFMVMGLISIFAGLAHYLEFRNYEQEDALSLPEPKAEPVPTPEEQDA